MLMAVTAICFVVSVDPGPPSQVADLPASAGPRLDVASAIGARIEPVLVPWNCAMKKFEMPDRRRPRAHLDGDVRRGASVWTKSDWWPSSGSSAQLSVMTLFRAVGRTNRGLVDLEAAVSSAFACS